MFKNMKLSMKIGVGFTSLILIAVLLGGLASWCMINVKTISNVLSDELVPEVGLANEVERASLSTMYGTRGYAYTEDTKYLEEARKNLVEVKDSLKKVDEHAQKYNDATLKEHCKVATDSVLEYERLLNQTVAVTDVLLKQKAESLVVADNYMKICSTFLESQNKMLNDQLAAFANKANINGQEESEIIIDRILKINLTNDVIDTGNLIRIGTWQAIASRDPGLFTQTRKLFDTVNAKLDELKAITKQEANLKQIEDCRRAGAEYAKCMDVFLENWLNREKIGDQRGVVAQAVLDVAKTTSTDAMTQTKDSAYHASSSLGMATTTMIIGLCVAAIVGVVLAIVITCSITKPINRIIAGLTEGAQQVASASGQVSAASQSLAEGATEQAAGLEETSSSLEEMSSMTK